MPNDTPKLKPVTRRHLATELLRRTHEILSAVPGAHDGSGTKTASIKGLASYHYDMKHVLNSLRPGILNHLMGEPPELVEECFAAAEAFIAKRKSQNWE